MLVYVDARGKLQKARLIKTGNQKFDTVCTAIDLESKFIESGLTRVVFMRRRISVTGGSTLLVIMGVILNRLMESSLLKKNSITLSALNSD